jgi:peptidoglycan/xylan/chitin deacetylase (PgdA/CDA1 family)
VLDVRRGRGRLPRHAVLLTFDDAYRDFARTAWPLLRERSIPAALFVPTAYPDHPDRWFWWERLGYVLGAAGEQMSIPTPLGELPVATNADRSRAFAVLRDHCKAIGVDASVDLVRSLAERAGVPDVESDVLGWEELRQLAAEGAVLAPHSRSHALLTRVPDDQLVEELAGSREDLERELGDCIPCFAYPSGDADQREADAAKAAGYELALTTQRGVNRLEMGEWTALRRVNVGGAANATLLRAQIGRWMTLAH